MNYNINSHSCYKLNYHLVVTTKYRYKCITGKLLNRLKGIFEKQKNSDTINTP
ncbi:transposase [Clostridium sp. D2Q-14]|uniref:transposase n=1 Tax=Anaeromonas gelatinilytica TaxID=2683194 RepID=UPI00193B4251|nr:transposase [Anaeromonas gelatinilytica]